MFSVILDKICVFCLYPIPDSQQYIKRGSCRRPILSGLLRLFPFRASNPFMVSFEFGPRILSVSFYQVFESFWISCLFCVYFVFNCYLSFNVILYCFVSCHTFVFSYVECRFTQLCSCLIALFRFLFRDLIVVRVFFHISYVSCLNIVRIFVS